ncbi:MAG: hydantoinase B/oxoprolinase family protein [Salinirussus sp.]
MADPMTVEMVRNALLDAAKEMQGAVMNAAYAPLWQEAGDLSCALLNADAEIVGQADRVIPIHVATMTNSVAEAITDTGGTEKLREGDVLFQNSPYHGNNHLPDFVCAQPVFADGTLLGFSAVRGHWVDVGGSSPTSYSPETGELLQEGLHVPPVKLYQAGERNDDIYEIVFANVRDPEERAGDLKAQLAGVRRGRDRLLELANEYGTEALLSSMATILDNEEARMRRKIDALPAGRYTATDYIDGDSLGAGLTEIVTTIEVSGDALTIDFEGTADQVAGGVNAPLSVTETAAYYAIKATLDPGEPGTSGAYRPVAVHAPEGSLLNPRPPAPVVLGNHETAGRIYDVVLKAVAEIDPEIAYAAGEGGSNGVSYGSLETEQFNRFRSLGGLGGCPAVDGITIRSSIGNTGVQSIERTEEDFEFLHTERFAIVPDTAGAGRFRGGNSSIKAVRFSDPMEIIFTCERAKVPPFGVAGGNDGTTAEHVHITPDGERRVLPSKKTFEVAPGSEISVRAAGGGGYGDPTERPPERVRSDVLDGYVSIAEAKDAYGVVIDEETMTVDTAATNELRSED